MIEMIVCTDLNNAIGRNNQLLAKQRKDMEYFKEKTFEKYVVMGRKTWESIGSKPLRNRYNVVLSKSMFKQEEYYSSTYKVVDDVSVIVNLSKRFPDLNIVIIGGSSVYEQFLPHVDRLYMTTLHHIFDDADSFFPTLNYDEWRLDDISPVFSSDENNEHPYQFKVFNRKSEFQTSEEGVL